MLVLRGASTLYSILKNLIAGNHSGGSNGQPQAVQDLLLLFCECDQLSQIFLYYASLYFEKREI